MLYGIPLKRLEWWELDPFINHYNSIYSLNFKVREPILDLKDPTRKQPELLAVDDVSKKKMVIEKKTIVVPKDYIGFASNNQLFTNEIVAILKERLPGLFQTKGNTLVVYSPIPRDKKVIAAYAESIVEQIIEKFILILSGSSVTKGENNSIVSSEIPIRWAFGKKSLQDEDEDSESISVQFIGGKYDGLRTPASELQHLRQQIAKYISDSNEKFQGYEDCTKLLVFSCYSPYFDTDYYIQQVVTEVSDYGNVNGIWLEVPHWLDDDDNYEIIYRLLYEN